MGVDSFFWHLTIELPRGNAVRVFIIGVETALKHRATDVGVDSFFGI